MKVFVCINKNRLFYYSSSLFSQRLDHNKYFLLILHAEPSSKRCSLFILVTQRLMPKDVHLKTCFCDHYEVEVTVEEQHVNIALTLKGYAWEWHIIYTHISLVKINYVSMSNFKRQRSTILSYLQKELEYLEQPQWLLPFWFILFLTCKIYSPTP